MSLPIPVRLFTVVLFGLLCGSAALAAEDDPVRVETSRYGELAFYPEYSIAAEVIATHDSEISAEAAAVVTAVKRDTAEAVRRNDAIVLLDCRDYEIQLQQARARLDAVTAQYDNAKKLFASARALQQKNNIAQETYNLRESEVQRLQAEVAGAKAGVESAQRAVDKCTVRAPYDGYISARHISNGEYVVPGTPLFRMVSSEPGRIEANVNHYQYASFLNGTEHRYEYGSRSYAVTIEHVLPVLDQQFRTHTARLRFAAEAAPTGSHGSLRWNDRRRALPSSMIVLRDGQAGVFTARDGRARFHPVEQYTEGQPVFIELDEDARVITTGRFGLEAGNAVTVR